MDKSTEGIEGSETKTWVLEKAPRDLDRHIGNKYLPAVGCGTFAVFNCDRLGDHIYVFYNVYC